MMEENCVSDCEHPFVGDGFCDDWFNWKKCGLDGEDCCAPDKKINYCTECFCLDETPDPFPSCIYRNSLGDDICDDFANTEMCGYDHGMNWSCN